MASITATVIYLGTTPDVPTLDPDGTGGAENASALVWRTFQESDMAMQDVTYQDANSDGFVNFDGGSGDGIDYDLGAGPVSTEVDQAVWYDITVTLDDNSTITTNALIFQTDTGDMFLTEFSPSLDNLSIQSIEVTAVNNSFFSRMSTSNTLSGTTICFAKGTLIMTPSGPRPVEEFAPGDLVLAEGAGAMPVRYVVTSPGTGAGTDAPIRFAAGSMGMGLPERALLVSPQHRMLCRSHLVDRMFGVPEVLIPAKRFLGVPGVTQDRGAGPVDYVHLFLRDHAILQANGAPTESCLWGAEVIKALPRIMRLGPGTQQQEQTCRPVPSGPAQRRFIARLIKNGKQPLEHGASATQDAA